MEDTASLKDNVQEYIETNINIIKLKAISKGAPLVSNILVGAAVAFLAIFFLMFLSFSAAYAISDASNRPFLGFLIVGGFYLVLAVLVVALKDKLLTTPIMKSLLESLYYKNPDNK